MSTKKFLSIILCLCMLVGMCQFTFTASAETTLSMAKTEFPSGTEIIPINVSGHSGYWWAAIYESSRASNDGGYCDYIQAETNGDFAFPSGEAIRMKADWPLADGDYRVVLFGDGTYNNVVGTCEFTISADVVEEEAPAEYYIKKGGNGNGLSAESPMGSVINIVNKINADGHKEGDLVTVYVIDSGEGKKEVIDSDCVLGYNNNSVNQVPEHKATIKWTSYAPDEVISLLGHINWQNGDSNGAHWTVSGPSIFEDINIVDMRNSKNGGTDIYLNHWPVEFYNVKFGDLRGVNETQYTTGTVFYPSSTHFAMGMIRGNNTVERDQYVYIDNADIIGDYLNISGYTDAGKAQGVNGNVTLEIGEGTLNNLNLTGSNAGATETIDGNLSIILGAGVTVNKINTTSVPVVTGVFNLIQGYGATIPSYTAIPWANASKSANTPYYNLIAGSEDVDILSTDVAGEFDVFTDGVAYAVSADKKTIFYGEDSISLEPGKWTVYTAADLDAVKAAVTPPEADIFGNKFQGWIESNGKLVASYGEGSTEAAAVFYAQFGASGSGLSEESPMGDLAALIDLINTEFGAGDEVTIKVIPAENQPTDGKWDSAEDSVFLEIGNLPSHAATLTITSIDPDAKSYVAFYNSWAESGAGGHWINNGPKVMKDITIIDNRTDNATRDINLNYHSCKFENANVVVIPKAFGYAFTNWKDRSGHFSIGGNRNNGTFATGNTFITLDAAMINSANDINATGYADGNHTTLVAPGNVTLELNGGNLKVLRVDGNKAGFANTFNGNLNILINGTSVDTFGANNVPTVKGVANIIKNGATVPETPAINGTVYDITAGEGVVVTLTEEDGVFAVDCDGIAYAASKDGRKIFYGEETIALEPGVYTVNVAASLDEIIENAEEPAHTTAFVFEGWDDSVEGVLTAVLKYVGSGEGAYYFVKAGGKGNGLSPDTPAGSIADAINLINTAGYTADDEVTIYVMDMCEEPYKYDINGNSVLGVNFYGNQNSKTYISGVTPWASLSAGPAACAADITIAAYDYETTGKNTWLIWNPVLGLNTNVTFQSNFTFENINLLGPRPYDREYFINGYDITFNDCKFYFLTRDAHSNSGAYDGGLFLRQKFMLAGSAGGGGRLTINSPYTQEGEYGIHVAGTGGGTYSKHVTVDVAHEDISTVVYFGGSNNAAFNAGFSLIVGNGAEVTFAKKDNIVNINGYELLAMEGDPVFEQVLPENVAVTGGTWTIQVDSDAMFIDTTDKVGTYRVKDAENLAAIAGCKETGATYFSADGILELPAGTYTVSSLPVDQLADMKVDVYFDNEPATGTHYAGYPVYLPILKDKPAEKFVGWEYDDASTGELVFLEGGTSFDIPEGVTEVFFYASYLPFEDTAVVYVDQENGNDEGDGSEYDPLKTISAAIAMVTATDETTKKVCVIGYYGLDAEAIGNSTPVIITGEGADKTTLDINNDCIAVCGPITFENLKFAQTTSAGGKVLYTRTNHVTFGEGLEIDGKFALRIGEASATSGPIAATFKSGNFGTVELGHFWCHGKRGTVTTADIIVDGANIKTFNFTSNGWLTEQIGCDYTGAVNISVNSGNVGSISVDTGHRYAEFKDTATIILNNGQESLNVSNDLVAPNGAWTIIGDSEIGMIETTSVPGTFKIGGEKTALVTNVLTSAQYVSSQGEITLPAGQYKVEYVDQVYYVNDGEKITVYTDCTIDLSTIKHTDKAGCLFLGWTFEDGTPCDLSVAVKEGDTLVANFVEFNAAEDFAIIGAQIRTSGVQGLRFIVEKSNDFFGALPEVSEFGTLVLPTQATWGRDILLKKDASGAYVGAPQVAEWQWDAATKLVFTPKSNNGYTPSKVVGEKLFKVTDDAEQYTLCITNITEDKYYRYYTVKGYAIYKDYNGIEHVLYSDYYQTNIYNVACKALEAGEQPAETFEAIKEYYEVDRKEAYMAANYDNRILLSGYPTTADTDPNHAMYQLSNGMKIREVEIDSGKGGDAVEIVHFADTHLNYINQKDMDLGEINTLSTYRGRSWLRNGSSVPNIARMMEYASFFDKAVITGDVMDYFSWGCAEIMTKMIVDQSKQQGNQVLMAMGNHEPAELMQADMSGLSAKYSLEYRYEVLQGMWTNNIYYHSEIVKNDDGDEKVMIVVLDNQRDTYWGDIQAVPFARDIEIAREKGLPILIFEHDPICTKNPAETKATYFYEGGDTSGIPTDMSNRFAGSASRSDADTMKVYNLIVKNPDVVKGVFCGHWHNHMYTEILAQNEDGSFMKEGGKNVVIPQYVVTANAYGQGNAIKITVK